jgi:glycerol-3-phosphate O-acyltransferase
MQRVNFNMEEECHALMKAMCALRGESVSEYVNTCLLESFIQRIKEDEQVRQMFMSREYKENTKAYRLKAQLLQEAAKNG